MAPTLKSKVKWDDEAGVPANAGNELPKLEQAYFAEVRKLLAGNPRPARLHRLRVSGKRLRYCLELFRPCYCPCLEERIESPKHVQDLLGQANDAVAGLKLIQHAMRPSRPRTRVERFARMRAAEKAKAFRAYWRSEFDAPGRAEWWSGYLAREAHAPDRK